MRTQNVDMRNGAKALRKTENEKASASEWSVAAKAAAKSTSQMESVRCSTGWTCTNGMIAVIAE